MSCPYLLTATTRLSCGAARIAYHPGVLELGRFCTGTHRSCPLYCNIETDGEFDLTKLDLWPFDHAA